MIIQHSLENIKESTQSCVLAIGNFDGVHRGHQELLQEARNSAKKQNRPLAVLTFEPHPRRLLRPDDPPFRITPFTLKAERLEQCGADVLFVQKFDWNFASQSAETFIEEILDNGIKPKQIIIGNDFRFGQLRKGEAETLRQAGYDVTVIEKIADEGESDISSSRIRTALRHGDITTANALLGWEWEIRGEVIHGDKRGREIGFPTANVALGETLHPAYGVYAAFVRIESEDEWHKAAVNIGIRPMFELETGQVEAHILDFDRDIYGKILHLRPVRKLRGEAKFDNLDDLIMQIGKDCDETRRRLGKAA